MGPSTSQAMFVSRRRVCAAHVGGRFVLPTHAGKSLPPGKPICRVKDYCIIRGYSWVASAAQTACSEQVSGFDCWVGAASVQSCECRPRQVC